MRRAIPYLIRFKGLHHQWSLSNRLRNCKKTQNDFLSEIIFRNQNTEYGKKYNFSSIKSTNEFQHNLPVVNYADIKPLIERAKNGEQNIFTAESVFMFNITSGTTAEPKYIPVTKTGINQLNKLLRLWVIKALNKHPFMLDKGIMHITGAAVEGKCNSGIPYGSASGQVNDNIPRLMKKAFVVPTDTTRIQDYDLKYYILARFALEKDVSFIATPNPLTLLKFAEVSTQKGEEIIRSIHNGWFSESVTDCSVSGNSNIPPEILQSIKPNKTRAAFLEKILKEKGELKPVHCLKSLSLIGCWLSGSVGFHAKDLNQFYGDIPVRDLGYAASEGMMSLHVEDGTPYGILATGNNFYEFIPEHQIDSDNPDILLAHQLEPGKCYKIIITNANGLYRYDLNDIIKVKNYYLGTPVISFLRKAGNIFNLTGEKLHLNHCLSAIKNLQSELSINIHQFRIVPDDSNSCHEFLIDLKTEVSNDFIKEKLIPALDKSLCSMNAEYDLQRKSNKLNSPHIHIMTPSWVDEETQRHLNSGKRETQFKWDHMADKKTQYDIDHIKFSVT